MLENYRTFYVEADDFQFHLTSASLHSASLPPNDVVWIIPDSDGMAAVLTTIQWGAVYVCIDERSSAPAEPTNCAAAEFSVGSGTDLTLRHANGDIATDVSRFSGPIRLRISKAPAEVLGVEFRASPGNKSDEAILISWWPSPAQDPKVWATNEQDGCSEPDLETTATGWRAATDLRLQMQTVGRVGYAADQLVQTSKASVDCIVAGLQTDYYELFSAGFNWLTPSGGAFDAHVGHEFYLPGSEYGIDPEDAEVVIPIGGAVRCRFTQLRAYEHIEISWEWLPGASSDASSYEDSIPLLAQPSVLTIDLRKVEASDTETVEVTLSHALIPKSWSHLLEHFWQWQLSLLQEVHDSNY